MQIINKGLGWSLVWGHLKYVFAKINLVCEACVAEEGNLTVLKRIEIDVTRILISAPVVELLDKLLNLGRHM